MPEYLTPGVYVEETSFRARSIEGVSTSTAGMAGVARYGPTPYSLTLTDPVTNNPRQLQVPVVPPLITSYGEFVRAFGDLGDVLDQPNYLAFGSRAFFGNGGRRTYIARAFPFGTDDPTKLDGFFAKRDVPAGAGAPVAQWRARWPGSAGSEIRVAVSRRVGKNIIVAPSAANAGQQPRLVTASEYALVYLLNAGDPELTSKDPLVAGSIRLVQRNPGNGELGLVVPGSNPVAFEDLTGKAAYQLQVDVTVTWNDRTDAYNELAIDPRNPRSILNVLQLVAPADDGALVWLWAFGDPVDAPALLVALLDPNSQGFLSGGSDGAGLGPDDLLGRPADPDDPLRSPSGLNALGEIDDIAIVAVPDNVRFTDAGESTTAAQNLLTHCESMRYRIAVVDPRSNFSLSEVRAFRAQFDSSYGALYYPWVEVVDPRVKPDPGAAPAKLALPPSGFVAGIYARSDIMRGVHKAPANEVVQGITRFLTNVTFDRQAVLNPEGINALRFFEGRSNRVWGARTMSSDPEWKYVNVRRLFIFLEHSIDRSTQWAVFEPNNQALWASITQTIEDFLFNVWTTGALMGTKPQEAYFVRCDRTTMSQNDLDNGRLVCLIGVAPTYPAEFVIFRIGQWTADAQQS